MLDNKAGSAYVPTEWISVKDRLPEKEGLYLVWDTPYSTSTNKCMIGYFNFHTKQWETDIAEDWSNVTHWMPLPGPPGGGDAIEQKQD